MPMFDFHCAPCARTFELLVRGGVAPQCPHCGRHTLVKQVSLPTAPARSPGIIASARKQAARAGHFSHYAAKERPRS